MNTLQELQRIHGQTIDLEAATSELIRKMENNTATARWQRTEEYEVVYPITMNPAVFKGKKPTAVIFGSERVSVSSWQKAVKEIMYRCSADSEHRKRLMNLRDKISGRERLILSAKKSGMRRPFEIGSRLYMETHYDTETLMRVLLTRVLDEVGYNYSNITVAVWNAV